MSYWRNELDLMALQETEGEGDGDTEPGLLEILTEEGLLDVLEMTSDDPCFFARQSSQIGALRIEDTLSECAVEGIRNLYSGMNMIRENWGLVEGPEQTDDQGLTEGLFDESGTVHSAEDITTWIQAEIRDEISRPMGFLENTCDEFFDEMGGDACDTIVRGELDPMTAAAAPFAVKPIASTPRSECNRALCDADVSPPSRDCAFLGVTSIRLGYRTDKGVETFGEPFNDCADRADVASTFEGVKVGQITPIAVVFGSLDPRSPPRETRSPTGRTAGTSRARPAGSRRATTR